MIIRYLTQLNSNPSIKEAASGYIITLQSISLDEIASLESMYNKGNQFPAALTELLYLAGNYCYVLDYGLNKSQQQMQDNARALMAESNTIISRSFFVIDVYLSTDQFIFVYLDEGDDPEAQQAYDPDDGNPMVLYSLNLKLSDYINSLTIKLLGGLNPF